jgi:hypothetical protein
MEILISNLRRNKTTGCVIQVEWAAIKRQDSFIAKVFGKTDLQEKDLSDPAFVPFDQLTEKIVLDWINPTLDANEILAELDRQLQEMEDAKFIVTEKPW